MTDFIVTSPEGKKFRVTAPEGATQDQVLAYAKENFPGAQNTEEPEKLDPTADMSRGAKFLAGAGKGMTDVARGVEQLARSQSPDEDLLYNPKTKQYEQNPATVAARAANAKGQEALQTQIDESRERDAPLMKTTAGKVGNIVGTTAATLPLAAVPGANTYAGAAAIGAGLGGSQPVATGESRLTNTALGAASGVAGKALGDVAATGLGFIADKLGRVRPKAPATPETQFMDKGYKIPPSMSQGTKPGSLTDKLEGFGGKTKLEQQASAANQPVHNSLARRALGLQEGDKISVRDVLQRREEAGKAYDAVKKFQGTFTETPKYRAALDAIESNSTTSTRKVLKNQQVQDLVKDLRGDMNPDEAIEIVKKLRADSGLNTRSMDPNIRALGRAQKKAAQAVDDLIDEHLSHSGNPQLYVGYRQARELIAKTYDVEKVLNTATGDVSAPKLAKLAEKRPLSGDLKTIADFAKAYQGAARDITQRGSRPGPSISPLDTALAIGSAGMGHGAPLAKRAAIAGVSLSRPLARRYLLSDMAQQGMRPQAGPTLEQELLPRAGAFILPQLVWQDSETRR